MEKIKIECDTYYQYLEIVRDLSKDRVGNKVRIDQINEALTEYERAAKKSVK